MSKITANIINSPKSVKGLKPLAYWCYRSDAGLTISGNTVTAVGVNFLGTFEGSKFFMNGGSDVAVSDVTLDGFKQKFTAIVNQSSEDLDTMDDIVLFVQNTLGQWLCLGAEFGMWKASQAQMSNDNLAAIAVEFSSREGMEEKFSEYFVTADLSVIPNTKNYEFITGLTMSDAGDMQVHIKVSPSKTAYFIDAHGVMYSSTGGLLDFALNPLIVGNVVLIIPKDTSILILGVNSISGIASDFIGSLNTNLNCQIDISGCHYITVINAPNSNYINASNCPSFGDTSVELLIDNAYSLYLKGQLTGTIDAGGTTSQIHENDISLIHGISYASIAYDYMTEWSITYNI